MHEWCLFIAYLIIRIIHYWSNTPVYTIATLSLQQIETFDIWSKTIKIQSNIITINRSDQLETIRLLYIYIKLIKCTDEKYRDWVNTVLGH